MEETTQVRNGAFQAVLKCCKEIAEDMPSTAPAIRHVEARVEELIDTPPQMEEKTDLEKELEGIVRVYRHSLGCDWIEVFAKTVKIELPYVDLGAIEADAPFPAPRSRD